MSSMMAASMQQAARASRDSGHDVASATSSASLTRVIAAAATAFARSVLRCVRRRRLRRRPLNEDEARRPYVCIYLCM